MVQVTARARAASEITLRARARAGAGGSARGACRLPRARPGHVCAMASLSGDHGDPAVVSEIRQIYAMYCPKSDQEVAKILSRFVGREAELLVKVRQKYGALPAGTASPPPSEISTSEEGVPPTPMPEPEEAPEFDLAAGFIAKPPSGDHSLDGEGAQTWRAQHKERSDWEEDGWYKSVTLHPDGTYDWSYTTYNIDLYDYDRSSKVTEAHGQWTMQVPGEITLDGVQGTRREWDSFKEYLDGNPDFQGASTLARSFRGSSVHVAFCVRLAMLAW